LSGLWRTTCGTIRRRCATFAGSVRRNPPRTDDAGCNRAAGYASFATGVTTGVATARCRLRKLCYRCCSRCCYCNRAAGTQTLGDQVRFATGVATGVCDRAYLPVSRMSLPEASLGVDRCPVRATLVLVAHRPMVALHQWWLCTLESVGIRRVKPLPGLVIGRVQRNAMLCTGASHARHATKRHHRSPVRSADGIIHKSASITSWLP